MVKQQIYQLTNRIKALRFLGVRVTGIRREIIYVFVHQSQSFPLLGTGNWSPRRTCRRFYHRRRTLVRPTHVIHNLILNGHNSLFFVSKIIKRKTISMCVELQEVSHAQLLKGYITSHFTDIFLYLYNLHKYI